MEASSFERCTNLPDYAALYFKINNSENDCLCYCAIVSRLKRSINMKDKYSIDILESFVIGRAIPQAVSRRLPTAATRVQNRSCGIL
jgi:hypothetical protein